MAAHSLVLFVGFGARPGPELGEGLARSGIRGLWLDQVAQALAAAAHAHFDAAVFRLDSAVSSAARQFHGWRQALNCPLLLLAETVDEVDEIMALEMGADGVLAQPVSSRRLRAHLLRLLRQVEPAAREPTRSEPPAMAGAAGWRLDRVHNRLSRGARHVDLTDLQAALLQVLLDDLGRVVPRARLLAAVSQRRALQPRSVDVYIARLRLRLAEARVDDLRLEGVRGRGYQLTVPNPPSATWPTAVLPPAAPTPRPDWTPAALGGVLPIAL